MRSYGSRSVQPLAPELNLPSLTEKLENPVFFRRAMTRPANRVRAFVKVPRGAVLRQPFHFFFYAIADFETNPQSYILKCGASCHPDVIVR